MYKIFSSSINHHQKLKTTQMSFSRWMNKSTIVHPIKFYFAIKWVNYLHTPEWTSKALFWVKEASLKSLHIIWFHLNDSIEIIKLSWWRTDQGLGVEKWWEIKEQHEGVFWWNCCVSTRVMELVMTPWFSICVKIQRIINKNKTNNNKMIQTMWVTMETLNRSPRPCTRAF